MIMPNYDNYNAASLNRHLILEQQAYDWYECFLNSIDMDFDDFEEKNIVDKVQLKSSWLDCPVERGYEARDMINMWRTYLNRVTQVYPNINKYHSFIYFETIEIDDDLNLFIDDVINDLKS